jgi:hypothetical protein
MPEIQTTAAAATKRTISSHSGIVFIGTVNLFPKGSMLPSGLHPPFDLMHAGPTSERQTYVRAVRVVADFGCRCKGMPSDDRRAGAGTGQ